MLCELKTAAGEGLCGTPWRVHPRPQMKRDSWLSLNGQWSFDLGEGELPERYGKTIQVPFCPESALSGIQAHFPEGSTLCYRRRVTLPENFNRGHVLLHIGAADQHLEGFVNGQKVGSHSGGYDNITFDITDTLTAGENEICLVCRDDLKDLSMPYGKQTLNRGGMWYTPVSGIWQSVWLESAPERYIHRLHIENRGAAVTISIEPVMNGTVTVAELGVFELVEGSVTIAPESPHFWSPEEPYLYGFTVTAGEDTVESYFAIRSLEIKKVGNYQRLCLNGKPYFFHGLLDQGYWPDGLLTPAAPQCYADDILMMKKLGFNTLRKHIKVEMEEFYYLCDKLGMIVFQDMVNNGDYNYARDTVMPTLSLRSQKMSDKQLHRDPKTRHRFLAGMEATVKQLKNHPCICYWTIFNEGWGQFDSDNVFEQFKTLDDTRFVDATSGWFRQKESDVDSRHVYFRRVNLKGDGKLPLVLSEFGGKTHGVERHVFNPDKAYGYGGCETREALNEAVVKLYMEEVVPSAENGLCAAIYTQVSDVEDEINGLVTYDRKVEKMDPEKMVPVAEALQRAVKVCGRKRNGKG